VHVRHGVNRPGVPGIGRHGLLGEGEWLVRRGESGPRWEHGHGHADVAVRGYAADLLQVLTRRAAPDRVEVLGDDKVFARWLENAVF